MREPKQGLGNTVAPPRFIAFVGVLVAAGAAAIPALGWRHGSMLAFDAAALVFLLSCWPLLAHAPTQMREAAKRNDANRTVLLVITAIVMAVVLLVVASELRQPGVLPLLSILLIIATLMLAWGFSSAVYTFHYAHMFYSAGENAEDRGGLRFPETEEPNYLDFLYFALCLSMTFQTSDVDLTDRRFRRVVTLQCLAAFVFNLGVLAFTISVLSAKGP